MSNNTDFRALLSEFSAATATSSSSPAAALSSGAAGARSNASLTSCSASASADTKSKALVEPTSTTDLAFSAPLLKERIERIMRIRQIRQSTSLASNTKSNHDDDDDGNAHPTQQTTAHIAICATIVDDFPHEVLWKKWMNETGGNFSLEGDDNDVIRKSADNNTASSDGNQFRDDKYFASADMYIHAKNPERVQSEWLRSKLLPISHRPSWNDVRIVRAILSLLETALCNEKTTHILLCTESCIPIATLKETARSVLLDEICVWKEEEEVVTKDHDGDSTNSPSTQPEKTAPRRHRPCWNQSYVDCYDRNSSRCTRFDEHNCWGILRDSLPEEVIYKALPGWCLLSRKHAHDIVNIPLQLDGMNLWPAFERVWAPEEVFLPTALAICGNLEKVSRRALTYCHWDTRASNQKDRAHPIAYDGCFDDALVSRARADGCLFLRKMKRPLNLSVWEKIIVQRGKGRDDLGAAICSSGHDAWRGGEWEAERRIGSGRYGNDRDRGTYDSRRSYNSREGRGGGNQRRKREFASQPNYDDSRKRSHWRR